MQDTTYDVKKFLEFYTDRTGLTHRKELLNVFYNNVLSKPENERNIAHLMAVNSLLEGRHTKAYDNLTFEAIKNVFVNQKNKSSHHGGRATRLMERFFQYIQEFKMLDTVIARIDEVLTKLKDEKVVSVTEIKEIYSKEYGEELGMCLLEMALKKMQKGNLISSRIDSKVYLSNKSADGHSR